MKTKIELKKINGILFICDEKNYIIVKRIARSLQDEYDTIVMDLSRLKGLEDIKDVEDVNRAKKEILDRVESLKKPTLNRPCEALVFMMSGALKLYSELFSNPLIPPFRTAFLIYLLIGRSCTKNHLWISKLSALLSHWLSPLFSLP